MSFNIEEIVGKYQANELDELVNFLSDLLNICIKNDKMDNAHSILVRTSYFYHRFKFIIAYFQNNNNHQINLLGNLLLICNCLLHLELLIPHCIFISMHAS